MIFVFVKHPTAKVGMHLSNDAVITPASDANEQETGGGNDGQ
jgi:hypothetical protein